jgi:hypothetical protein
VHERRRAEMATREPGRNSSRRSTGCRSTTGVPSSCVTWRA